MEGTFLGKPRDLGYAKRVFKKKLIILWPTTAARTAAMILGGVAVVGATHLTVIPHWLAKKSPKGLLLSKAQKLMA